MSYQQTPITKQLKSVLLLVNPFAGRGKGGEALQEVTAVFDEAGIGVDVFESKAGGDIKHRTRDGDLESYDALCIIGGDGTTHEALNGMHARADGKRLPLALVPCGTGNALVSAFTSPSRSPKECARSIVRGQVYKVDAGKVHAGEEEVLFFNVINWPSDYARRAESMRWLGPFRYSVALALDIIWGRTPRLVKMHIDDEEIVTDVMIVHIQNTKTCGNALLAAPDAKIDDGMLDMFFVHNCPRLPMLQFLQQVASGAHVTNPNATFRRFKRLSVEPLEGSGGSLVMIDGEVIGTDPLSVEVLPSAFEVII